MHVTLITGEAGTGKTTWALNRLAQSSGRVAAWVPHEALVEVCSARVPATRHWVRTLSSWMIEEASRHFALGECRNEARAAVRRLKRHPCVADVCESVDARPGPAFLFELWGDRALVEEVVLLSNGDLTTTDADAVLSRTQVQFAELDRYQDGSLVLGADGEPLHVGTDFDAAGTHDLDDIPVLFASEPRRERRSYDVIFIDEVQDVAPLELQMAAECVRAGGNLILAGDDLQQLDDTAWFRGFDHQLDGLAPTTVERIHLAENHRLPDAVRDAARGFRQGGPLRFPGECLSTEAWASRLPEVAIDGVVVVRGRQMARRVRRLLRRTRPHVPVLTPEELQGREFDRVVVADLDPAGWPDSATSRRALYVAITRAKKHLLLITQNLWSPLIDPTE